MRIYFYQVFSYALARNFFNCGDVRKSEILFHVDVKNKDLNDCVKRATFSYEPDFTFHFVTAEHPWIQNAKKTSNVPLGDIVRTRLKQFSVMNRFKKRALRVSVHH